MLALRSRSASAGVPASAPAVAFGGGANAQVHVTVVTGPQPPPPPYAPSSSGMPRERGIAPPASTRRVSAGSGSAEATVATTGSACAGVVLDAAADGTAPARSVKT